jgi:hypothetical protein
VFSGQRVHISVQCSRSSLLVFSVQEVLLHNFQIWSGLHSASHSVSTGFFGDKAVGTLYGHSPPSRVEVKSEWSYTSNFLIRLHVYRVTNLQISHYILNFMCKIVHLECVNKP